MLNRHRYRSGVVQIIIILNVVVFLMWNFLGYTDEDFMVNNFLVSWSGLLEGRFWPLLTSVFSHNMFLHLFLNMYILMGFGSVVERALGTKKFLRFYLTAGILASLAHCVVSAYLLKEPAIQALGASGAIAGVVILFSLMFPKEKVYLFGFIPLPAIWSALLIVGLDLWGLFGQAQGGGLPIGHGAHLGGALVGLLYFVTFRRKIP